MSDMQRIPLDRLVVARFTPPALAEVDIPPVFTLKVCTRRDRERLESILIEENLRRFDTAAIRAEMLRALEALWSADVFEAEADRLRGFWDALDQYENETREAIAADPAAPIPPFDHPDADAVADLSEQVYEAWPKLPRMAAANHRYDANMPLAIMSIAVARWEHVDTTPRRAGGSITMDSMAEMFDWLIATHGDAGRTAWHQLYGECIGRLYLLPSAEKNSASPPPSTPIPTPTPADGASTTGPSPASESSTETPATLSTPNAGD